MIARRRSGEQTTDDVITRLTQAEIEGVRLTDDEIRISIFQLTVAGSDPVTSLIGKLIYHLLRQPELWKQVNEARELVPQAIEETLRYDPPLAWLIRTCTHATEMQGVKITPGMRILLGLASANRDETIWTNPDDFSLNRPNANRHLSFGYGIHFCLGAELARLEARIVLETLLDYFPTLHLAPNFHYERGGRRDESSTKTTGCVLVGLRYSEYLTCLVTNSLYNIVSLRKEYSTWQSPL